MGLIRKSLILILAVICFFQQQQTFANFSSMYNKCHIKNPFTRFKTHGAALLPCYPQDRSTILRNLPPPKRFVYKLPILDSVYIYGNVKLKIIGNQSCNKMILRNSGNAHNADIKYFNNSLYIGHTTGRIADPCNRHLEVILYVCRLQRLTVAGNNCVYGQNLCDPCGLEIITCGGGSICLEGPTHLKRIINTGNTVISAHQVETDHLHIVNTCAGRISLCGCTGLLLVRSFGVTTTDLKCLHAQTAYLQTGDSAFVMANVSCDLRVFAAGCSNIYYFTCPRTIVKHNSGSANILQYANW